MKARGIPGPSSCVARGADAAWRYLVVLALLADAFGAALAVAVLAAAGLAALVVAGLVVAALGAAALVAVALGLAAAFAGAAGLRAAVFGAAALAFAAGFAAAFAFGAASVSVVFGVRAMAPSSRPDRAVPPAPPGWRSRRRRAPGPEPSTKARAAQRIPSAARPARAGAAP